VGASDFDDEEQAASNDAAALPARKLLRDRGAIALSVCAGTFT
jgi:hypothetical protein